MISDLVDAWFALLGKTCTNKNTEKLRDNLDITDGPDPHLGSPLLHVTPCDSSMAIRNV